MGSAILLFSCKSTTEVKEESLDNIKTEESENLTIIMSENGRKSYLFEAKLLEGYTLGRDPYREFRKGISITTFQDDSLSNVNAVLVANYAIYYENRKLWEAKGDVVVTKHDGTRLYTQQLFWNSMTKRIYSNVDTKLVTNSEEIIGEGFESDEEMTQPRFRHWKGRVQFDSKDLQSSSDEGDDEDEESTATDKKEEKPKEEKKESSSAGTSTTSKKSEGSKKVEAPVGTPPAKGPRPGAMMPPSQQGGVMPLKAGGPQNQQMQLAPIGRQTVKVGPTSAKPSVSKEAK